MASWKLASCRLALCAGLGAAGTLAAPMAALARPAVEVRVDLQAPSLANLPQREFVQREVARKIVERFRDRYRLFAWSPAPGPDAQPRVATLVARVTQAPADPLPTIDVDWVLEVPGRPDYRLPIAAEPVYESSDMRRALTEPDVFRNDLDKSIREVLKEGFFDRFRDDVLQRIPIARQATPIPQDRMVAVPLLWTEAQLSHEAVLRVWFERNEGGATKRGSLDIDILNERTAAPGKGQVQGGIQAVHWDTGPLPVVSRWNAQLPSLLQGASIWCHIAKYKEGVGGSGAGQIQFAP